MAKDLAPLHEKDSSDPNVKDLIQSLQKVTGGRIYVVRWNFAAYHTNAPVGLAVKRQDVEKFKTILGSIVGNCQSSGQHHQFDISRFSGKPGTHMNVYTSGRIEMQGGQVGEGKNKRFPISTGFVLGEFHELVTLIMKEFQNDKDLEDRTTDNLTQPIESKTPETEPKRVDSVVSINETIQLEEVEELFEEKESSPSPHATFSQLNLSQLPDCDTSINVLNNAFGELDYNRRSSIIKSLINQHEEKSKLDEPPESRVEANSDPNTQFARSAQMPDARKNQGQSPTNSCSNLEPNITQNTESVHIHTAAESVEPQVQILEPELEANYKIIPIFVANTLSAEQKNDPRVLLDIINTVKPNAAIGPVQVMKSGDIKITPKSIRDYEILRQPWKTHEVYGMFSPKLPSSKTVDQVVLILGLNSLITEREIKESLNDANIFPKGEGGIHRFHSDGPSPPVKLILDSKLDKDRLLKDKFHIYHQVFKVVDFEEAMALQCFRCQGFHHQVRGCSSRQHCNRCGGDHKHDSCTVKKEEACCCNCNGNHAASYRGCPAYKKAVTEVKLKQQQERAIKNISQHSTTTTNYSNHHPKVLLAAMAECLNLLVTKLKPQFKNPEIIDPMIPFTSASEVGKKYFNIDLQPQELHQISKGTLVLSNFLSAPSFKAPQSYRDVTTGPMSLTESLQKLTNSILS